VIFSQLKTLVKPCPPDSPPKTLGFLKRHASGHVFQLNVAAMLSLRPLRSFQFSRPLGVIAILKTDPLCLSDSIPAECNFQVLSPRMGSPHSRSTILQVDFLYPRALSPGTFSPIRSPSPEFLFPEPFPLRPWSMLGDHLFVFSSVRRRFLAVVGIGRRTAPPFSIVRPFK